MKCKNKLKLRTSIWFKSEIDTEEYVLSFLPRGCRSSYAKLHQGKLPLLIETGRYDGVALKKGYVNFVVKMC